MAVILLTGDKGFIGRHVRRLLEAAGHTVTGIDCLEPRVHGGTPDLLGRKYCADIGYTDYVEAECIIHLAAQVGVADSMIDPVRYVRDNTMDTAIFLNILGGLPENRPGQLKRLVVASSMSVYGDPHTERPITERHPITPASVYGLTKFDQERLCLMWGERFGVATTALRFFNVYGPGQALHNPYTGVLANFANWLLNGQQPVVYEDGQQTRDFIYVEDVARAVVTAATQSQTSAVYNVCTGQPTTIAEAALIMAGALGSDLGPNITHSARPGDIRHCIGDNTAIREGLLWTPKVSFKDGMTQYAEYLKAHHYPAP